MKLPALLVFYLKGVPSGTARVEVTGYQRNGQVHMYIYAIYVHMNVCMSIHHVTISYKYALKIKVVNTNNTAMWLGNIEFKKINTPGFLSGFCPRGGGK